MTLAPSGTPERIAQMLRQERHAAAANGQTARRVTLSLQEIDVIINRLEESQR